MFVITYRRQFRHPVLSALPLFAPLSLWILFSQPLHLLKEINKHEIWTSVAPSFILSGSLPHFPKCLKTRLKKSCSGNSELLWLHFNRILWLDFSVCQLFLLHLHGRFLKQSFFQRLNNHFRNHEHISEKVIYTDVNSYFVIVLCMCLVFFM